MLAERTDVGGVVTQPDRPSGRGHKLQPSPVKAAALELGLHVYQPTKLKGFVEEIAGASFDLFALASYGRILPQSLLNVPRLGALNVHPSLLPKYRGATPIQTALRNGDSQTGVSIMLMDAGMDTGDLVLQEAADIDPHETYGALHDRLALYGGELLGRALDQAEAGSIARRPQHGEASVTAPITKDDLIVDRSWDPRDFVNAVRALSPSPGARLDVDGEVLKVLRAHVEDDVLCIDEVVAPNRGKMAFDSYLQSRRDREPA